MKLVDSSSIYLKNPSRDDLERPETFLLKNIIDLNNLDFTAKYIFNVDLAPFQINMLNEMFLRAFPMIIASRGASKTWSLALYAMLRAFIKQGSQIILTGSGFRQSKILFDYCEKFWYNAPILREILGPSKHGRDNGPHRSVDRCEMIVGESIITALPVGCLAGDTLVTTKNGIFKLQDLKNQKTQIWGNSKYRDIGYFYENGIQETYKITTQKGYEYIGTKNHKMKVMRNGNIEWVRTDEMKIDDEMLIDCSVRWHDNDVELSEKYFFGLGNHCVNKDIPNDVMICGKNKARQFILGIIKKCFRISPTNNLNLFTEKFAKSLQFLLLHFGLISERVGNILKLCDADITKLFINDEDLHKKNIKFELDKIKSIENNGSIETFDINVPDNHEYCANGFFSHNSGEKIRGIRANCIISDEFKSQNPEIFEEVILGFAAVSQDPIKSMQNYFKKIAMMELGIDESVVDNMHQDTFNQTIIAGTADYTFNHFYKYWRRWKTIIESGGDKKYMKEQLDKIGDTVDVSNLNYKDFSIIRIPYDLIPKGFMDTKTLSMAMATMNIGIAHKEYGAVFVGDSDGFFKRSVVESCVTKNPIKGHQFHATISGSKSKRYVYGIDPASESDKFAIAILELDGNVRKLVYLWTTNRAQYRKKLKGDDTPDNFYAYAARKIRNLMRVFPCERIGMDAQGGGRTIEEQLHDKTTLLSNEELIWPIIDKDKSKETDKYPGLHILEICQFANADWASFANHGLKKDFEDKNLLLPYFDAIELEIAGAKDRLFEREDSDDSLEDCVNEIEELKDELASIVHSKTPNSGRERWDTPEKKTPGIEKKGRMRKDRYSALLIANAVARKIQNEIMIESEYAVGRFVSSKSKIVTPTKNESMYYGYAANSPKDVLNSKTCPFGIVQRR